MGRSRGLGGGQVKGNKVEGRVGVRCRLKIDR